ncbi:hypothetical protein EBR21_07995, partial [bacterium]|nr:hypothetical protein [bacterium]
MNQVSSESDVATLHGKSDVWWTGKQINHYLYSFPTWIGPNGEMEELCWYYKEVVQTEKPGKLVDALRTAVKLHPYSVNNRHIRNKLNQALAGWGVNAALSGGLSSTCQVAAASLIPFATGALLTGAGAPLSLAAVGFTALCAMG